MKKIKYLFLLILILLTACGKDKINVKTKDTLIVAQGADARTLDSQKAIDTPSVRVYQQLYNLLVKKDENMEIVPDLAESWEIGADARTLDSQKAIDTPSVRVYQQLYNLLVKKDENMEIVPDLAESWEIIDLETTIFHLRKGVKFHNGEILTAEDVKFTLDRMQEQPTVSFLIGEIEKVETTIFHLRKGVKFHNGEILTAEDVKFTLDRMQEQPTVSFLIGEIEKVEVIDENTVKVITKRGFGPLLKHLSHPGAAILNKKAVLEAGDAYGQHPIGTGPYKFVDWQSGDRITLKAFEDYYEGKAKIENIVIRSIPEGTNRTIALETGEVDIVYDVEPVDIDKIKENKKLNFLMEASLGNSYLGINTTKAPFNDVRVRQAMAYAINVKDIIEVAYKNTAVPANSPIGPKIPGYNKDAKMYEFNREKAKNLLAEAGYPNGFKTSIWVNDNIIRKDIATILQDQFKAIGIEASIETLEWGAYIDRTARGEHDMFILGWVTVTGDGDYGLYPLFHTSAHGRPGNRAFYSNPKVDELLDIARTSIDQNEREEAYKEVQKIVQEEVPVITMVYTNQNVGMQKYVTNFKLHPTGFFDLYNIEFTEIK